jgi:transposase
MPQPITVPPLDAATRHELTRRFNQTPHPETRLRYQMVLLAQQGYAVMQISPLVLRSHDTVGRVLHRFLEHGLDAVPRRTAPGRSRQVTPAWEAELLRVIELDPHTVGVPSANWTTRLLAQYLTEQTGVAVGLETVRTALHRHDYVCKRPTWTLKRKAEEQPGYQGNA